MRTPSASKDRNILKTQIKKRNRWERSSAPPARIAFWRWKYLRPGGIMGSGLEIRAMFPPSYYSQRAAEVETMAKGITDLTTREMCLELAQRFRDIANMKSLTQQSDIEVMHLAERMVGKTPRPDKQSADDR
jgi:hypothetical protein